MWRTVSIVNRVGKISALAKKQRLEVPKHCQRIEGAQKTHQNKHFAQRRLFSDSNKTTEEELEVCVDRLAASISVESSAEGASTASANSRIILMGLLKQLSPSARKEWLKATETLSKSASQQEITIPEPSFDTLKIVALTQAIPFVGFGIMDNSILIIAGDAIDTSLGVWLGISTMCAAAIGNIVSDVAGIMLGTVIEDFCAAVLKIPPPDLTTAQRNLRSVRFAGQFGCAAGIVFGCVIGMFPLLFLDSSKVQSLKKAAHLESIFRDVVTEAKSLVQAESTWLYLRVHAPEKNNSNKSGTNSYKPAADGEYLYAKYHDYDSAGYPPVVDSQSSSSSSSSSQSISKEQKQSPAELTVADRLIPLGKGIVSRAALTGEAWNIFNVKTEPDFLIEPKHLPKNVQNMVCVPVLDGQGRTIAVIQALNKISDRAGNKDGNGIADSALKRGFTDQDVQILKALASHISVSLQSLQEEDEGAKEEVRLRDTIRFLKEQGLDGIVDTTYDSTRRRYRKLLFPEE